MLLSYTLHEKALSFAKEYLKSEKELLSVLMQMDEKKVFWELKYTGVFNYCLKALLFSESQASYFASIVRKSREVPELKEAIDRGEISISKAKRETQSRVESSDKNSPSGKFARPGQLPSGGV